MRETGCAHQRTASATACLDCMAKGYLLHSLDIVAPDSLLELYLELLNVPLILDLHIAPELLPNRRAICSNATSNRTAKRYLAVGLIRDVVRGRDHHNHKNFRCVGVRFQSSCTWHFLGNKQKSRRVWTPQRFPDTSAYFLSSHSAMPLCSLSSLPKFSNHRSKRLKLRKHFQQMRSLY